VREDGVGQQHKEHGLHIDYRAMTVFFPVISVPAPFSLIICPPSRGTQAVIR
jgi:hypothetical protein